MKKLLATVAAAAVSLIVATAAHAATFDFTLKDHPSGGAAGQHGYGLRLDGMGKFFSLEENGAEAYLQYNDVDQTAIMWGKLVESTGPVGGPKSFGSITYNFVYTLSGLTSNGAGGFVDYGGSGSGTVFDDATNSLGGDITLGAAARTDNKYPNPYYFFFGLDPSGGRAPSGDYEGAGWVNMQTGANDFLFTAELCAPGDPNCSVPPPPNMTPVPLPAAGWMLIAGLGGLAAMGRRKRA